MYLSADPDDIMSPSGDHEHLIKFWNVNQNRIYDAFIIWTFLNQRSHSQNLMATVYNFLIMYLIKPNIGVKPLHVWVLWSQELTMLVSALTLAFYIVALLALLTIFHPAPLPHVSPSHNPPPPHGEEDLHDNEDHVMSLK